MSRMIIDLSIFLENDVVSDPPAYRPRIEYIDHKSSIPEIQHFFPGLRPEDLPDGEAWAIERVSLITHNGTHLDAPYHYASTMDGGRRAMTIDEIPLNWCFQPGIKLDFRHLPDGYVVTAADVEAELARIGHSVAPLEIGVRLTGTDAWSWDAPFVHTREEYSKRGDAGLIWEGHKAGREIGYCHLEKLHNLEDLPPTGFTVACFPVKIRNASAGWTRAVAILD